MVRVSGHVVMKQAVATSKFIPLVEASPFFVSFEGRLSAFIASAPHRNRSRFLPHFAGVSGAWIKHMYATLVSGTYGFFDPCESIKPPIIDHCQHTMNHM
jgi:hypothetical protein